MPIPKSGVFEFQADDSAEVVPAIEETSFDNNYDDIDKEDPDVRESAAFAE